MATALFVAVLLVVIGIVQGVIWFSIIRALRRLTTKLGHELRGTPIVRGPERVHYQGATGSGPYPRARGFVAVALTRDRLVVRRLAVRGFDVPLREIKQVSQQLRWNGRYRNGKAHVVIETRGGAFAIQPADPGAWIAAVEETLPPRA